MVSLGLFRALRVVISGKLSRRLPFPFLRRFLHSPYFVFAARLFNFGVYCGVDRSLRRSEMFRRKV